MSAPVLSWLFNMARETAETAPPCGTAPRHTLTSPTSVAVLGRSPLQLSGRSRIFDAVLHHSTLRANLFPEVTDLSCRLPLPTLFYRLEAAHLGDLMRLWVRPGVKIMSLPVFQGPSKGHRTPRTCSAFPAVDPYLQLNWFQGKTLLSRKDNSTPTFRRRHRVRLCYHQDPTSWFRNINLIPFR